MTETGKNLYPTQFFVTPEQRAKRHRHKGKVLWFSGLSGAGKTTLANHLEAELFRLGFSTHRLDGDNIRSGLNQDLSFSIEDRKENLRRIAQVSKLFIDAGIVVLASFITPFQEDRVKIKNIIGAENIIEIYVDSPLEICEARDTKGLYKKARKGDLKAFTGVDSPFEIPQKPDVHLLTHLHSIEECLQQLTSYALAHISHQFPTETLQFTQSQSDK